MLITRARRRLAPSLAVAAVLVVSACGGGGGPDSRPVLARATESTRTLASGSLSLRVAVFGNDPDSGRVRRVGFELLDRFDTSRGTRLPVASMTYTTFRGEEIAEWPFSSTGDLAFVDRDGTTYQVPATGEAQVVAMAEVLHHLGDLQTWVLDPKAEDRGALLGVEGEADPIGALHAVFALGATLDAPNALPDPGAVSDDALTAAFESGTVSIRASDPSNVLRRLDATIVLDAATFPEMAELVGSPETLRLEVELSVRALGGPLDVPLPADLRPWEDLAAG